MELKELLNIAKRKPQKSDRSFGVFYSSKFPSEIYKMRHPGLDDKEYKYIEENWVNPVQKLVGDAIFETQKIFSDGNYSIQTKNETIRDYIDNYEIMSFFKNIYWQNIILDSDSVLTYHIKYSEFIEKQDGIELGNEYLPVRPYIVTSENILFKDKTTLVYKVKGDKRNNFVALYYNQEGLLTYEHYSYDNANENTQPILFWQFNNNLDKKYYRHADGLKIVNDNELVIKSYFSPSESILSTIIIDSVNVGVTKTRSTYPIPVIVGESCEGEGCMGGVVDSVKDGKHCTETCHVCKGTGSKNLFSPFNAVHVVRGSNAVENSTPPAPHVYWVDPPQGALDSTRAEIRENRNIAFDYLGITYANTEVHGRRTALEAIVEHEKKYETFKMYSQDAQMTMQWWYDNWVDLMFPLEAEKEVDVFAYNNFRVTSTAQINKLFTELQKEGAPLYMQIDLLKEYYNSIGEPEKFKIVNKYYLYENHSALIQEGSLGYYDKVNIVISKNIMKWVDEVMEMNESQIDKYLRDKAKALMLAPVSTDGGVIDLYTQLKTQTENAGMEVKEVEGKVIVTGSPE